MGNAGFVSHQWVAKQHPDPEFKQMKVLQDALQRLLNSSGYVPLDWVTEVGVPSAKGISYKDFQSRPLFLWYDYFSVPQLGPGGCADDDGNQAKAIMSIPAYVARCRYFFALCPTIDCPFEGKVLNVRTWAWRGWCRMERAARELSEDDKWILIQSPTALEVVGTHGSFVTGSVGEGEFAVEADRAKLAPIMEAIVNRKLILALRARDWPSYRRNLNLQAVYLRGLEPMTSRFHLNSDDVAGFLQENGLRFGRLLATALCGHVRSGRADQGALEAPRGSQSAHQKGGA